VIRGQDLEERESGVFGPLIRSLMDQIQSPSSSSHFAATMSSSSIKITYSITPPSSVIVTPDLPKTKSTEYPISPTEIPPKEDKAGKAYYGELRKALEVARTELGEDLTRWRDLAGKAELSKEAKRVDDDEDIDEQEEDP